MVTFFLFWTKSVPVRTDAFSTDWWKLQLPQRHLTASTSQAQEASPLPVGRATGWHLPAAPGVRAGRVWKSGEKKRNISTVFWLVGSLIQIASDSAKWVFTGTVRPVRRKRGAWTKSDRCTSEMKIQELFAFVVIKHTVSSAKHPARQEHGYFSDNPDDKRSQLFL